jgi:Ni,Fe-hydrogenase III small subunit
MLIEDIRILAKHGRQSVPDLTKPVLPEIFRGRPEILPGIAGQVKKDLAELCPVNAILQDPFCIDLGKCVFCKECQFYCPDQIHFTSDYKISVNRREALLVKEGAKGPLKIDHPIIRPELKKIFKHSLKLRQVSAAGDNSAEMELNAAGNVNFDMGRFGIEFVASPRHADGIVITGPVSENMSAALEICYDAVPDPRVIILVGTDAISGGIFNGSPALNRKFLEKCPVDLYVPGNPPHPLTFINGLLELTGRV